MILLYVFLLCKFIWYYYQVFLFSLMKNTMCVYLILAHYTFELLCKAPSILDIVNHSDLFCVQRRVVICNFIIFLFDILLTLMPASLLFWCTGSLLWGTSSVKGIPKSNSPGECKLPSIGVALMFSKANCMSTFLFLAFLIKGLICITCLSMRWRGCMFDVPWVNKFCVVLSVKHATELANAYI